MEDLMSSESQTTSAPGSASVLASNGGGGAGGKQPKMASAIPPSPLKILREDSVDGTLSPVSSKSTGTDTDTDTRKKVISIFYTLLSLAKNHWSSGQNCTQSSFLMVA